MNDPDAIRWPEKYAPGRAPVHVRNELTLRAPCAAAWAWLVRAQLWPTWYPNSANVTYLNSDAAELADGTRFRWKTFGVTIESTVLEHVPGERIAWDAHGIGVDAYHAWVLTPAPEGCRVRTEGSPASPALRCRTACTSTIKSGWTRSANRRREGFRRRREKTRQRPLPSRQLTLRRGFPRVGTLPRA
jgi:hypothetical protein